MPPPGGMNDKKSVTVDTFFHTRTTFSRTRTRFSATVTSFSRTRTSLGATVTKFRANRVSFSATVRDLGQRLRSFEQIVPVSWSRYVVSRNGDTFFRIDAKFSRNGASKTAKPAPNFTRFARNFPKLRVLFSRVPRNLPKRRLFSHSRHRISHSLRLFCHDNAARATTAATELLPEPLEPVGPRRRLPKKSTEDSGDATGSALQLNSEDGLFVRALRRFRGRSRTNVPRSLRDPGGQRTWSGLRGTEPCHGKVKFHFDG